MFFIIFNNSYLVKYINLKKSSLEAFYRAYNSCFSRTYSFKFFHTYKPAVKKCTVKRIVEENWKGLKQKVKIWYWGEEEECKITDWECMYSTIVRCIIKGAVGAEGVFYGARGRGRGRGEGHGEEVRMGKTRTDFPRTTNHIATREGLCFGHVIHISTRYFTRVIAVKTRSWYRNFTMLFTNCIKAALAKQTVHSSLLASLVGRK